VIPFEAISASPDPIKAADREWRWNCLVDATARLRNLGIDPYLEAAAGNPAAVMAETAGSLEADLLLVGHGHDRRWQPNPETQVRPPRTPAQRPLRHADRPREQRSSL
jgi:hypothetical protein